MPGRERYKSLLAPLAVGDPQLPPLASMSASDSAAATLILKQVRRTIRKGYRFACDVDLSRFFDQVQHDVLMSRVARSIKDKRRLKLIGRHLQTSGFIVVRRNRARTEDYAFSCRVRECSRSRLVIPRMWRTNPIISVHPSKNPNPREGNRPG